jgi:RecA/RadA recombinase
MAKTASKSAETKETAKKDKKKPAPDANPRNWTLEQRREAFIKARKEEGKSYQVKTKEDREELVPYGFLTFDYVLGLGGIARNGRVSQVHGDEGAGKSTLTYELAKNYQMYTGEPLGIFDFERTGTTTYLERIGVDLDMCKFMQPDDVWDSVKETLKLIEDGVRFFIYDSIPRMKSMVDRKDIMSGKAFKANYGKHAQTMTKFFDLLLPYINKVDGHIMMINQTRDRIEDTREAQYAQKYPSFTNKPYTLPGGRICRFTPSVMVELKLEKAYAPIKEGSKGSDKLDPFVIEPATPETEGLMAINRVRARTLKNKVTGGGFREGYIWIRPGIGIDENMSVREYAREYGFIGSTGGGKNTKWFVGKSADEAIITYDSKDAAIEDLVVKNNPEVLGKLKVLVAETIRSDNSGRFTSRVTAEEVKYMEGDDDAEAASTTAFEIEEDEV